MSFVSRGLLLAWFAPVLFGQPTFRPEIPKVWDEAALAEWATPIAGLNLRPKHISAREYYALPIENLRTYPVYAPGREPEGYWKKLQELGPQALIDTRELKTEADWVRAGKRVFDEIDFLHLRTLDAKYINEMRNAPQGRVLADGTIFGARWVPTKEGVALTYSNCSFCHTMFLGDGTRVPGAPFRTIAPRPKPGQPRAAPVVLARIQTEKGVLAGGPPFFMAAEPIGMQLYRAYGVPWRKDDPHERLKSAQQSDYEDLDFAARQGGITRWNGSPLFPAKVPDLIGIQERKYIDHTATHLHRGIGDIMRYAALVTSAEASEFGPHQMMGSKTRRAGLRVSDEALYALALYLYTLQPPPNPNAFGPEAAAGQKLFSRECAGCHAPPLYTSNKVTLAQGFKLPKNKPATLDVLPLSVGTDAGLALQTRKGTGYYKIPSLKGLWYRGRYLHDGSVASLEEMFNPDRLKETHLPGGFRPLGTDARAIPGHDFGLNLKPEERQHLIAFLKTL